MKKCKNKKYQNKMITKKTIERIQKPMSRVQNNRTIDFNTWMLNLEPPRLSKQLIFIPLL